MRVERFKAPNIKEALRQVKETLGPEAVILHTRSVPNDNFLGLGRSKDIEVIAALDRPQGNGKLWPPAQSVQNNEEKAVPKYYDAAPQPYAFERTQNPGVNRREGQKPHERRDLSTCNEVRIARKEKSSKFSEILDRRMTSSPDQQLWLKSEQQIDELKKDVSELKKLLQQSEQRAREKKVEKDKREAPQATGERQKSPTINRTDLFSQINAWLIKQGLVESIAQDLVAKVRKRVEIGKVKLEHKTDIEKIYQFFCEEIANIIPTLKMPHVSSKPKVIAFVGPPGSGKSSACAKIAVKNAYLFGKKVALILANMSPNGVTQHLASVANIAQLPLAVVQTTKELEATIAAHQDKDLILIDFAGNNKCGVSRVSRLNRMVGVALPHETHLVLPANLKPGDALAIASKFSVANFDRVIFSRIDETVTIGSLVEIIKDIGKPISYFSTGPSIPDDIEPASGFKLANLILRG